MVENGLAGEAAQIADNKRIRSEEKKRKEKTADVPRPTTRENKPIRQDLTPLFTMQGVHEQFKKRGISKETCQYLGCGYLGKSQSSLKGRIVFQVRGIKKDQNGNLQPVILSHIIYFAWHQNYFGLKIGLARKPLNPLYRFDFILFVPNSGTKFLTG